MDQTFSYFWLSGVHFRYKIIECRGSPPLQLHQRSRIGIYLGHSLSHAGSVALVLKPKTRLMSAQFHIVVDDDFAMVPSLRAGTMPDNWQ